MRRIASIFLLGILLFNWFGYRLVIGYWQERAKIGLEARLDVNDYDGSQLISIKVAATHLAYYNSSTTWERVDGSLELNGVVYKYVKRRLYNDTLEWLCLPDQGTMKLRAYANALFRLTSGLQAATGRHAGAENIPLKAFTVDPYVPADGLDARVPCVFVSFLFGDASFSPSSIAPGTDEQPPDWII